MRKKPHRYNAEMVAKILASRDGPKAEVPGDADDFMRRLNDEQAVTKEPRK